MSENKKEKNPIENTFHLAITMAGAVSAGAYTAGVIDYLLETLDNWEAKKDEAKKFFKENPDESKFDEGTRKTAEYYKRIPTHDIKIEILSGASAGGMTSIMTSAYLHLKERNPITLDIWKKNQTAIKNSRSTQEFDDYAKTNLLYNSWVNITETETNSMLRQLLSISDYEIIRRELILAPHLKNNSPKLVSALNSTFIRKLARKTIDLAENDIGEELPPYVDPNFDNFVTMTNLEGFQTVIMSSNKKNELFVSKDHRDAISFNFGEKVEGIVNIKFTDKSAEMSEKKKLLLDAAIATGAFPIGLEYATIERPAIYIRNNPVLKKLYSDEVLKSKSPNGDGIYRSTIVDGGVIDNEPFELTQKILFDRLNHNKKNATVLMIDPFPSETKDSYIGSYKENPYPYSWTDTIYQFLAVMRTQSLVKLNNSNELNSPKKENSLILKSFDEDNSDYFMIAPRRYVYKKLFSSSEEIEEVVNGEKAIACGSLFGFGGFLSKEFRQHDFMLGRINCQAFLRKHFIIKTTDFQKNSVVINGYGKESQNIFKVKDDKNKKDFYLPIIPDISILDSKDGEGLEKYPLSYREFQAFYPTFQLDKLDAIKDDLIKRLSYMIETEMAYRKVNTVVQFGVKIGIKLFKNSIFNKIKKLIEAELIKWKLA